MCLNKTLLSPNFLVDRYSQVTKFGPITFKNKCASFRKPLYKLAFTHGLLLAPFCASSAVVSNSVVADGV